MPELPEVQTVVDTLAPRVVGKKIYGVIHARTDMIRPAGFDLCKAIRRHVVKSITRRAKRIVFELDDSNRFYIHLGMSGRMSVESPAAPIEKHTHLIIRLTQTGEQIRFRDPRRFGGIFWLGNSRDETGTAQSDNLGPEPLVVRPRVLHARLQRTRRAIKNALLDQNLIAGLGNIYVDESLFEARIHPLSPANELTDAQVRRLSRAIKLTLRRALRNRGSTLRDYVDANGQTGAFQKRHRVYGRANEKCRVCKSPIQRIVLGGRSTHFCAKCQPRRDE
ncbi:DNA-formamidopyrimidine glycosylase [soil metagenome]